MDNSNKLTLEAKLNIYKLSPLKQKELAAKLQLPENTQRDLLFMSAILVSTGTNKNGATFLGSELIKARGSIALKPLDIEHKEEKIIGHIVSNMYMDLNGNTLDDEKLFNELASDQEKDVKLASASLDKMTMDIGIVCVVYKDRFPALAEEIEKGDWKVSMECYYDDFDVKIGELIIPKSELSLRYSHLEKDINKDIKLVLAGRSLGTHRVSRVLRNIRFCGVGIVKNPANEKSLILEAATDNLRTALEREQLNENVMHASVTLEDNISFEKVSFTNEVKENEVVQLKSTGYFLLKNGIEVVKDSYRKNYNEIAKEAIRRTSLDSTNKYYIVSSNSQFVPRDQVHINEESDAVTITTNEVGDIIEMHSYGTEKEVSDTANRWGPQDNTAGICISFEKFIREFPGRPNPGRILATHWCKLFNKACPVFGADAHDSACLRHKYSHMIKVDNIHGDNLVPSAFDSTTLSDDTELLSADRLPAPKPLDEVLSNKRPEGTSEPTTIINRPIKNSPQLEVKGIKVNKNNLDALSSNLIRLPKELSKEERSELSEKDFGLPETRQYPINNSDQLIYSMNKFSSARKFLGANQQKELFRNIILRATSYNIDTKDFENKNNMFRFEDGMEYSSEFGIPRLQLFPLTSREQIISAMSRFRHIKIEISDIERKQLAVNILRAAKKFNINSKDFWNRVKDTLN
jgi:hypothetical protein